MDPKKYKCYGNQSFLLRAAGCVNDDEVERLDRLFRDGLHK